MGGVVECKAWWPTVKNIGVGVTMWPYIDDKVRFVLYQTAAAAEKRVSCHRYLFGFCDNDHWFVRVYLLPVHPRRQLQYVHG